MAHMRSARRGVAGADLSKAGRLFERENTQSYRSAQPLAGSRFERMVEHLHSLGTRPLAEMLDEIATATGRPDIVADLVAAYAQLDPEIVRALGADSFAPMPLELVR